jgi:hypothetical protein
LEANEVPYGVYSDSDVANEPSLHESKVWIFNVHSEYWSDPMVESLEKYVSDGGHVIFASGNNMYRNASSYDGGIEVFGRGAKRDTTEIAGLIGAFYSVDGYDTYASYRCVADTHWIFYGSGVNESCEFGSYSANEPSEESKSAGQLGASGWETDKLVSGEFSVLAIGTNEIGPAFMVFRETEAKGWIFNASSISFVGALQHDSVIDQIMLNLIRSVR